MNNAAFQEEAPFLDTTLESWNARLATALTGVYVTGTTQVVDGGFETFGPSV